MAVIRVPVVLNVRAALWLRYVSAKKKMKVQDYAGGVLLKHLYQTPGVDLSQSPFSEPKGVSDGKEG